MDVVRGPVFRYLSVAIAALSLPALCFSGFVFFALWAASLNGLGLVQGVAALLLALSLPALCIFGPVQARASHRKWWAWAWLMSPTVPLAGLLLTMLS
jgi:hypothetical protein